MEYEKCYIFEPDHPRPAKRQRTEAQGLQNSWKIRREAYRANWGLKQKQIDSTLDSIHLKTVSEVSAFLEEASSAGPGERIPTGLVATGPNNTLLHSIIRQLSRSPDSGARRSFVSISSSAGSNLKTLLKSIIQTATSTIEGIDDDEEEQPAGKKGARLLNYDLEILSQHVQERQLQQVVIGIQDTEAFDSHLLSELIELIGCWHDRIPFVFLFSIATSVDFLQQRLSKAAVKCLNGRLFNVAPPAEEIERVFEAITGQQVLLWIGPNLMSSALERQHDYIQSIENLVDAVRYAYMSCYYANALSIFLDTAFKSADVPSDHLEAVRNLNSFRTFCKQLLANKEISNLRGLLDSDEELHDLVRSKIQEGREALADMLGAIDTLRAVQSDVTPTQVSPRSKLYVLAMSNKLNGSTLVRSLLLTIRKSPSNTATRVLDVICALDIPEDIRLRCSNIVGDLRQLIDAQPDPQQPLRSEDDVKKSTLRTTVVAQKVELSEQKSSLSKQDTAYSAILRRFTDVLEDYFTAKFINPKDLVLHEIFIYDFASPHREVFTPRPRQAVERALAAPHDYLDCECCAPGQDDGDEATLSATQPATAVLYQLYLESGTLINASDLWQAFHAIMGEERAEEQTMALFQRALAELKYLGFVKSTRRRVDHVAKVSWRGL